MKFFCWLFGVLAALIGFFALLMRDWGVLVVALLPAIGVWILVTSARARADLGPNDPEVKGDWGNGIRWVTSRAEASRLLLFGGIMAIAIGIGSVISGEVPRSSSTHLIGQLEQFAYSIFGRWGPLVIWGGLGAFLIWTSRKGPNSK